MTALPKALAFTAAVTLPMLASAQNLITNGSFENGLAGWAAGITPVGSANPVTPILYGSTAQTYGEPIPVDQVNSFSPDAAGSTAVYFAKDDGVLSLSQSFTARVSGLHYLGFSAYLPINGFGNPNSPSFTVSFGLDAASVDLRAFPAGVWFGLISLRPLVAGMSYTASFTFSGTGLPAKDIVIDRVYAVAAVPEPGTCALMAAGLAALGFAARRRHAA